MGLPSFAVEGLVVGREEPAEGHRDVSVFSAKRGLLKCRCRLSASTSAMVPDLFADLEAMLKPIGLGHLSYLGEWQLTKSRPGIGADYNRLAAASALARLILRNARWLATFERISILMSQALDALDLGAAPDAVRFKALYWLVRFEGYPVKEAWRMHRSDQESVAIGALLNKPVETCETSSSTLERWRQDLERWIVAETDFML